MASLGQLRIAPSGHVLGIDTAAALRTARARGLDEGTISELLQAAEAGLVEALNLTDPAAAREDPVHREAS